jgi:uncharacterized protein (TIGR02285 family)
MEVMNPIQKSQITSRTICLLLLSIIFSFNIQATESKLKIPYPQGVELHSDDRTITDHINLKTQPLTASVDTVQMLMGVLEWDVQLLNLPFNRSLSYMKNGKTVCVVNKRKTPEREKQYRYSLPINFFESQKFYQLAELPPITEPYLNQQGEITSIHTFLNSQPNSTLLKPNTYTYGPRIDSDIAKVNKRQIIPIANESFYHSFIKMFTSKRTDYAIIYPISLYAAFGNEIPIKVRSYPIADNPKYVTGHFLCSDTEQGRQLIESVNLAMKKLYPNPEYILAHTRYLPNESAKKIREIIAQYAQVLNINGNESSALLQQ